MSSTHLLRFLDEDSKAEAQSPKAPLVPPSHSPQDSNEEEDDTSSAAVRRVAQLVPAIVQLSPGTRAGAAVEEWAEAIAATARLFQQLWSCLATGAALPSSVADYGEVEQMWTFFLASAADRLTATSDRAVVEAMQPALDVAAQLLLLEAPITAAAAGHEGAARAVTQMRASCWVLLRHVVSTIVARAEAPEAASPAVFVPPLPALAQLYRVRDALAPLGLLEGSAVAVAALDAALAGAVERLSERHAAVLIGEMVFPPYFAAAVAGDHAALAAGPAYGARSVAHTVQWFVYETCRRVLLRGEEGATAAAPDHRPARAVVTAVVASAVAAMRQSVALLNERAAHDAAMGPEAARPWETDVMLLVLGVRALRRLVDPARLVGEVEASLRCLVAEAGLFTATCSAGSSTPSPTRVATAAALFRRHIWGVAPFSMAFLRSDGRLPKESIDAIFSGKIFLGEHIVCR